MLSFSLRVAREKAHVVTQLVIASLLVATSLANAPLSAGAGMDRAPVFGSGSRITVGQETSQVEEPPPAPAGIAAPEVVTTTVSAGNRHTCVLRSDESIYCRGDNNYGQTTVPLPNSGFAQVSAGDLHTCAIRKTGAITCWGNATPVFTDVPTDTNFAQVDVGYTHACAVKTTGDIVCWGDPAYAIPPAGANFVQVSAAFNHTCALTAPGTLACSGGNTSHQADPPAGNGFAQVGTGYLYSCARKTDGSLVCWGDTTSGKTTPPPGNDFINLGVGSYHACAIRSNGSAACWGLNTVKQTVVPDPNVAFAQISSGGAHTCALKNDATLICWGSNTSGQAPQITIQPASPLPEGAVQVPYGVQFSASGGTQTPYAYSVVSGTLPSGIALDMATGELAGTPTAGGWFDFFVQAKDANAFASARQYTLTLARADAAVVLTSSPNPATDTQAITFTAQVTSTAGVTPTGLVTFALAGDAWAQTLTDGAATYITSALPAGAYVVTATYGGDAAHHAGAYATLIQVVNAEPADSLTVTNDSPTRFGQPTTFTATASSLNVSYLWNYGDQTPILGPTSTHVMNHIYGRVGLFTAIVTATSGEVVLAQTTQVTITGNRVFVPLVRRTAYSLRPRAYLPLTLR